MGDALDILAFHGFLTRIGGAEKAFVNMLTGLKKRGHRISLWTLNISKDYSAKLREQGIDVNSLGMEKSYIGRRQLTLTNDLGAMRRFGRMVKKLEPYDVALVHHYEFSPLLARRLKGPVAYYCQEPPRHYYEPDLQNVTTRKKIGKALGFWSNWLDMRLDRGGVEHVDVILTNSDYSREYVWRTYGKMPVTVYLGVDVERFRNLGLKKEKMVLAVGANYYLKAHDLIVRSIGKVPKDIRPRLTVIGKGDRHAEFMQLARDCDVDVEIVDKASDEKVVELYNRAAATVIAYVMEPFGLVALESMACETPVIAVREGGLRESVTPDTGILTGRDEQELADAIAYMLRNPQAAIGMGKKGRERVEKSFTWERCAEDLEKVLRRISRKAR